jgi:hypothetical protein
MLLARQGAHARSTHGTRKHFSARAALATATATDAHAQRAPDWIYNRILYFSGGGTWCATTRPSYDSAAKIHASAALHATE